MPPRHDDDYVSETELKEAARRWAEQTYPQFRHLSIMVALPLGQPPALLVVERGGEFDDWPA